MPARESVSKDARMRRKLSLHSASGWLLRVCCRSRSCLSPACCRESCDHDAVQPPVPPGMHLRVAGAEPDMPGTSRLPHLPSHVFMSAGPGVGLSAVSMLTCICCCRRFAAERWSSRSWMRCELDHSYATHSGLQSLQASPSASLDYNTASASPVSRRVRVAALHVLSM
jgi:hypothetical protein